ncbi:MAG: ABC transporter ATP-binding protein [Actinobacteria bacterium]|nr:MAG: ABC transporter ATP-binding protein [Actinomycetota bacterium]
MEPKLRIEGASKIYATKSGAVHALEDFSLDVHEGELVCILGPSGCGKTTLLWALSGLHALSSGRILLDGTPVVGPRPKEIGMIFQDANLLPWRNLRQNIEFPFEIKKRPVDGQRIDALLGETGLRDFVGSMPRELSGGMQQRASIVRALAQNPGVLLMDEPFGALDAFTRDEMNLLLMRLWSESGQTIVFVTHNISEAIFLADRVVVMTPRPGRLARVYEIDLPRPRTVEMMFESGFIELVQDMKRVVETGGRDLLEVE